MLREACMSDRSQWKMLHLLYVFGNPTLTLKALEDAGVDCYPDTIQELIEGGAVIQESGSHEYSLSKAARTILRTCLVANRRWDGDDLWVDYPRAFVIMPFSEPWSKDVYEQMLKPAIEEAGLECVRGDTSVRVGDLTSNIWNDILVAGLVVADVSALNANVFYELGLTHALGKDTFILKHKGVSVPADFGGAHYYEYELSNLHRAQEVLSKELMTWASDKRIKAAGVKALKKG
jgi:hypothetical protein